MAPVLIYLTPRTPFQHYVFLLPCFLLLCIICANSHDVVICIAIAAGNAEIVRLLLQHGVGTQRFNIMLPFIINRRLLEDKTGPGSMLGVQYNAITIAVSYLKYHFISRQYELDTFIYNRNMTY